MKWTTTPGFWSNLKLYQERLNAGQDVEELRKELIGSRFRFQLQWEAWTTRKGTRAWRVEVIESLGEITFLVDDQLFVHRLLKNGKHSRAKDAKWDVDIKWFLESSPSVLTQLAECAE